AGDLHRGALRDRRARRRLTAVAAVVRGGAAAASVHPSSCPSCQAGPASVISSVHVRMSKETRMQSYLNGFHTGDPDLAPVDGPIERATDEVDVLVVGTGPAGAVLTAQLSAFPGIRT